MINKKTIPQIDNIILLYSKDDYKIHNKVWIEYPPEKFNKVDKWGRYYESCGGGRSNYKCDEHRKIYKNGKMIGVKFYSHEKKLRVGSIWDDCMSARTPYPTQKPYALLERIILLSTK
jgi:DNA modification methylase